MLEDESGGVRVSAHVPAVASHKQNVVIRLGMRRDMVQPTWAGVTIIVDEVSLSGKGEIEVTAMLGINTKILRAGDSTSSKRSISRALGVTVWALQVLAGPGCDDVREERLRLCAHATRRRRDQRPVESTRR